ncbi:MAG: cell division protein ZapA [Bacteroidales bacterium]
MNEIPITVNICDRPYKLMISPDEESLFREAAQRINERMSSYSQNYAFKDMQDLLSMVALQYTFSALKSERALSFREKDLLQRLQKLNDTLSF